MTGFFMPSTDIVPVGGGAVEAVGERTLNTERRAVGGTYTTVSTTSYAKVGPGLLYTPVSPTASLELLFICRAALPGANWTSVGIEGRLHVHDGTGYQIHGQKGHFYSTPNPALEAENQIVLDAVLDASMKKPDGDFDVRFNFNSRNGTTVHVYGASYKIREFEPAA